jgi:hypothetical protein
MSDADGPLAHRADPAGLFKNLGKIRGAEVAIEITGEVTKQDVVSPCRLAILIAAGADLDRGWAIWSCALIGQLIALRAPWQWHDPAKLTIVLR